jgi:hypothetical protein
MRNLLVEAMESILKGIIKTLKLDKVFSLDVLTVVGTDTVAIALKYKGKGLVAYPVLESTLQSDMLDILGRLNKPCTVQYNKFMVVPFTDKGETLEVGYKEFNNVKEALEYMESKGTLSYYSNDEYALSVSNNGDVFTQYTLESDIKGLDTTVLKYEYSTQERRGI